MEMESAIMECPGNAEVAVVGHHGSRARGVRHTEERSGADAGEDPGHRTHVASTISKIAVPERIVFTDVLSKTLSGTIMRRLLKEIVATGEVRSDVTALEDRTALENLKALVKAAS
jgi:acetyl-CoA synthetase